MLRGGQRWLTGLARWTLHSINKPDAATVRLHQLHEAVHETFRTRDESEESRTRWRDACAQFHREYNALAFPGGLDEGLARVRAHDPEAIELAIQFLELDPYFFRSGYIKAELLRRLKRAPLTKSQQQRLRNVILARLSGPDRRELRDYCRLAAALVTPGLHNDLRAMATSPDARTARHARWALAAVDSAEPNATDVR